MSFTVTKTLRGFSTAHRNHHAESHCKFIHGYDRTFTLVVGCDTLDQHGWVFDFAAFKDLKAVLDEQFDHTLVVAHDDPWLPHFQAMHDGGVVDLRPMGNAGMEGAAEWTFHVLSDMLDTASNRRRGVRVVSVTVAENEKNSATYHSPQEQAP